MRSLVAGVIIAVALLLAGCTGASPPSSPARAQHLATRTLTIYAAGGGKVRVEAEIADTGAEREKGLMYRTSMPENHGMLFVFDHPAVLRFWMKNTLIPLSVAFIDSKGRILDIQSMKPQTETVHSSTKPARYALEMNQGFFRKHHIEVGDKVAELPE